MRYRPGNRVYYWATAIRCSRRGSQPGRVGKSSKKMKIFSPSPRFFEFNLIIIIIITSGPVRSQRRGILWLSPLRWGKKIKNKVYTENGGPTLCVIVFRPRLINLERYVFVWDRLDLNRAHRPILSRCCRTEKVEKKNKHNCALVRFSYEFGWCVSAAVPRRIVVDSPVSDPSENSAF